MPVKVITGTPIHRASQVVVQPPLETIQGNIMTVLLEMFGMAISRGANHLIDLGLGAACDGATTLGLWDRTIDAL